MEYYSALKKNDIRAFTGKWMELENIMLKKINESQRTKDNVFSNMWMLIHNGRNRGILD